MTWFTRQLRQTATYWAPSSHDYRGKVTWTAPVAISVRWDEVAKLFLDRTGKESVSDAEVFLKQDVVEGGYLFLGTSTAADPLTVSGAHIIRRFDKNPDIKNRYSVRQAYL